MRAFAPADTTLHFTRLVTNEDVTFDNMRSAVGGENLVQAAGMFTLIGVQAVALACTSMSFAGGRQGESELLRRIAEVSGTQASTTSTGMARAFQGLGVRRVALVTPYVAEINASLVEFLRQCGVSVVALESTEMIRGIAEMTPDDIRTLVLRACSPEADAVFISCTNLATAFLIDELEQAAGRPVMSANQVTIWDALRLGGLTDLRSVRGWLGQASSNWS